MYDDVTKFEPALCVQQGGVMTLVFEERYDIISGSLILLILTYQGISQNE